MKNLWPRRGMSLLDLVVGLFVLFVAMCGLAAALVASARFFAGISQRSVALDVLEQWLPNQVQWYAGYYAANDLETLGYSSTNTCWNNTNGVLANQVVTSPVGGAAMFALFDPAKIPVATLTETSPLGVTPILQQAFKAPPLQSICAASTTNCVAFNSSYNSATGYVYIINDNGGSASVVNTTPMMPLRGLWGPLPLHPLPGEPGGLACDAGFNTLYVADMQNGGIYVQPTPLSGVVWTGSPLGGNGYEMVVDLNTLTFYGTSASNGRSFVSNGIGATSGGIGDCPLPPLAPLGCDVSIDRMKAAGAPTSDFWVSDIDNLCLRRYTVTSSSTGTWDGAQYKPSLAVGHMGLVRGLAITDDGTTWVIDGTQLWSFTSFMPVTPTTGVLSGPAPVALPPTLVDHASGMCLQDTAGNNALYVCTKKDGLWKITAAGGMKAGVAPTFTLRMAEHP